MKISQNNLDNDNKMEVQTGPKLRNVYDEAEVPEEKPEGADFRLKLGAAAILALILIIGIKGNITNSSLSKRLEEQEDLYTKVEAEALLYGIVEDEDGELVVPDVQTESIDVAELEWDSIDQRNNELITSFTKLLLSWEGQSGYERARQKLMDEWQFKENSKLLKQFMPPADEDMDGSMKLISTEQFLLETDGKNMTYFIICTVRTKSSKNSATGTVGIKMTVKEDGTLSNVSASTLAYK